MHHLSRGKRIALVAGAATAVTAAVLAPPATADSSDKSDPAAYAATQGFRKAVSVDRMNAHLEAFQRFADEGGTGNRVGGTAANKASVDYVADKARAAGLDVTVQPFEFVYNADLTPAVMNRVSPDPRTYVDGTDFASMTYSPNGDVTANVAQPTGSALGCDAADFSGFPAGSIALVSRGTCAFAVKGANAAAAGATAVIVYNNVPGTINGTLSTPQSHSAPVIGTSQAIGQEWVALLSSGPVTARVKVDRLNETRTTYNVLAETPGGDPDNVVVVGAHIDSVPRGPGINDNGSGSAGILAMAEALEGRDVHNKVRFAWWNAEEFGLLGSRHYVSTLPQAELDKIALNLNFDMIGSPNAVRFVYDGDNSAFPVGPGAAEGPDGSGLIEEVFHDYFADAKLPSAETPFSGRSDYGPFIEKGIPAGGLFTGAEGVKTVEQAAVFGGTAGQAYDPCYHLVCDTIANVNATTLDEMADAAAHTMLTFARWDFSKSPLVNPATVAQPSGAGLGTPGGGGLHDDHDHEPDAS